MCVNVFGYLWALCSVAPQSHVVFLFRKNITSYRVAPLQADKRNPSWLHPQVTSFIIGLSIVLQTQELCCTSRRPLWAVTHTFDTDWIGSTFTGGRFWHNDFTATFSLPTFTWLILTAVHGAAWCHLQPPPLPERDPHHRDWMWLWRRCGRHSSTAKTAGRAGRWTG